MLLVDSDAFAILGAAGLLFDLADALGVPMENIRRLPALGHQLRKSKRFQAKIPESHLERLLLLVEQVPAWEAAPADPSLLDRLVIDGIDGGEALLFATLNENRGFLLTTGDKRSMISLGRAEDLGDIRECLRGRVVALEMAITILIKRFGASSVGERLRPLCKANNVLDIVFGYKDPSDAEAIRQLVSYLTDLELKIGPPLLFDGSS